MYVDFVHTRCVCVLQVPSMAFMLSIVVSNGALSLLNMMEEPTLEIGATLGSGAGSKHLGSGIRFLRGYKWCGL